MRQNAAHDRGNGHWADSDKYSALTITPRNDLLQRRPDRVGYDGDGEDEVGGDDQGDAAAVDPAAGHGQGEGGDGEDAVPDGNPQGAAEAGAGDDHGGDQQPGQDVECVAVERFAERGRGPAPAGEEDGCDGVGHAGDRGQDNGADDHAGHGPAGAERRGAALHGRAGHHDDGKREDSDGGVSRAALIWVDGVGQFLFFFFFFFRDCPGEPGSQPWREREGGAAGGAEG